MGRMHRTDVGIDTHSFNLTIGKLCCQDEILKICETPDCHCDWSLVMLQAIEPVLSLRLDGSVDRRPMRWVAVARCAMKGTKVGGNFSSVEKEDPILSFQACRENVNQVSYCLFPTLSKYAELG